MDRARVIDLSNKYFTNKLTMEEAAELLSEYAKDRGKTNQQISLLMSALPALVMQLSSFIETALEWYAKKYHITIIKDVNLKPIKFL
ncbi:MAG: hypothetical protein U0K68_01580 [Agathobacter sp.]|nr:hypothetical protein [Agathobacter sp.]